MALDIYPPPAETLSGPVEITNDSGNPIPVSGTVAVTGVATETTLAGIKTGTDKIPASPATETSVALTATNTTAISTATGTTGDAEATGSGSVIAILKRIRTLLGGTLTVGLPSGAATSARQPALGTAGTASADVLSVQGVAGGVPAPVGGTTTQIAVTLTRPADTTAYAASDVVSNSTSATTPLTLAGCARANGGSGYLTKVRLWTNQSANTARFRLHLFTVNNPTVGADNAAYALLWANRTLKIGSVTLPAMQSEGGGSDAAYSLDATLRLAFVCAGGDTNLYAVVETLDSFTPTSGQLFYLQIAVEQN